MDTEAVTVTVTENNIDNNMETPTPVGDNHELVQNTIQDMISLLDDDGNIIADVDRVCVQEKSECQQVSNQSQNITQEFQEQEYQDNQENVQEYHQEGDQEETTQVYQGQEYQEQDINAIEDDLMLLELECDDEPLEMDQLIKAKNMRDNFERMLKDVAKLKKQTRILTSKRTGGTQLLGVVGSTRAPVSLVRPVMPTVSQGQQQNLRFVQQPQIRPGQPVAFSVAPRITNRNTVPVTTGGQVQITNPGSLNQVIRTNTGNVPLQQIPSLLFDTQSGLLLMPQVTNSIGGIRLPISQANSIMTSTSVGPNLQSTVGGGARPRFVYSPQQTANRRIVPGNVTAFNSLARPQVSSPFSTPRIVSTSMLDLTRPTLVSKPGVTITPPNKSSLTPQVKIGAQNNLGRTEPQNKLSSNPNSVRIQPAQDSKKKDNVSNGPDDNTKTFPSLVVNVKPCLLDKPTKLEFQRARGDLDGRVKALLVYSPSKFTEWLMQRGLLRLEHKCSSHLSPDKSPVNYKLGMYSDGNKQPFSGGYVWISECCPDKQISVFQGSIFEASVYPPGTLFKLIYHWSCQTTAANVLQWVKVTSYYLKNFYTLLRSACVAALHELCSEMGGPRKFVEVGIITLGTTMPNQANGAKQVKVEILGVFDPATKAIRLKVVNPQSPPPNSTAANNRVLQILWPLKHWVDKESTILIDMGIEKSLIYEMGFRNVIQCKNGVSPKLGAPTNVNVMNYLKHVVPKMFQNTLCVLSKSLIQQFLDELCWRELWGQTPASTFDNMVIHLVQMTKWDTGEPLITRLNKISLNPFGEWSYSRNRSSAGIEMLPDSIRGINDMPPLTIQQPISNQIVNFRLMEGNNGARNLVPKPPLLQQQISITNGTQFKRKPDLVNPAQLLKDQLEEFNRILRTQPKTLLLHSYYYAESAPEHVLPPSGNFPPNLKCPLCSKQFSHNQEVLRHIFMHVQSMGVRNSQRDSICDYCLKEIGLTGNLNAHINDVHKMIGVPYACLICQEKFNNERNLILHMWENHFKQDMPYRCEICDYRNSFHYEVLNHFTREHGCGDSVLCPHCLKVLSAKSFACMKQVVVHVQSHAIRKGKKCPQCALVFTTDGDFRHHLSEGAHHDVDLDESGRIITSFQNDDDKIKMPVPPARAKSKLIFPPAKKTKSEDSSVKKSLNVYRPALRLGDDGATQIEDFRTKYILPMDLPNCLECNKKMDTHNHFPAFLSCVMCRFNTSCRTAMNVHLAEVHPSTGEIKLKPSLKVKRSEPLPTSLSCGCGFATKSPLRMARHLVNCDRTTAYSEVDFPKEDHQGQPSTSEKLAPTPTSFLDQLGLTRNPE